ncbi:hypothetical protein J2S55_003724 [Streptosporangium brasiliense]|uniref:Uncharacterized protein n=1 Tax=Streptosporangium brasiliense TaxID=47480 RepID=A0ABT9R5P2_9ACTN|nr:hypothetical protein [Streptosporangium brasiliense]
MLNITLKTDGPIFGGAFPRCPETSRSETSRPQSNRSQSNRSETSRPRGSRPADGPERAPLREKVPPPRGERERG